jgi:hypothetical protein
LRGAFGNAEKDGLDVVTSVEAIQCAQEASGTWAYRLALRLLYLASLSNPE